MPRRRAPENVPDPAIDGEWLRKTIGRIRRIRDEAGTQNQQQLAYLLEGAAREAEAKLPNERSNWTPRAFSPQMLADRWQCSAHLVRTLVAKGELQALPIGGKMIRISQQAIEAYEAKPAFPRG